MKDLWHYVRVTKVSAEGYTSAQALMRHWALPQGQPGLVSSQAREQEMDAVQNARDRIPGKQSVRCV